MNRGELLRLMSMRALVILVADALRKSDFSAGHGANLGAGLRT
jgi:hypothetical protein